MHLVFWQPIPSFHQEGFLNALAATPWVASVSLYYEGDIPDELKKSGWPPPQWQGVNARPIRAGETPVDSANYVHFFTGFYTHTRIWKAFDRLERPRSARVFAFAEAPALFGWRAFPRQVKYRINGLRLKHQLDGVLALGERGRAFYSQCLGAQVPVHQVAYYDRALAKYPEPSSVERADRAAVSLLYVGRIIYLKGLDRLFQALAKLPHATRPWKLTLVGDGPERASLQALAQKLGIAEHLHWTGAQNAAAVGDYYQSADYLVQPSRGDGWGMTIIEALRYGCEVIASTACGAADLAKPEWRLPVTVRTWPQILSQALEHGPLAASERKANLQRATVVSAEAGVAELKEILMDPATIK